MKFYKIILTKDYISNDGYKYTKGQTGVVSGANSTFSGNTIVVYFDGYDKCKRECEEFKRKHGEDVNIVPFIAEIPKNIIKKIEDL